MQRYERVTKIINPYKTKALSYAEYRTATVYHACVSLLDAVDNVQRIFFNDIGIAKLTAFINFNSAPLNLRRDIAVLDQAGIFCGGSGVRPLLPAPSEIADTSPYASVTSRSTGSSITERDGSTR